MNASLRRASGFVEFERDALDGSIPDRFARQVERYPERIAVSAAGVALTYRELSGRVDRVARSLLAAPIPTGGRIALLLDRDAGLVASALAVLKAGSVWVPLDVGYPVARNSYIVEDSQAALLLTDAAHAEIARELTRIPVLTIEELDSGTPAAAPRHAVPPGAGACLLYTSGSTGVPKGVLYDHRTLLQFVMRYTNSLGIGPDDRLAQLATFSHIAGVSDTLRALLNGAAVLPLDPRRQQAAKIVEWLETEEITLLHLVPSVLRHVASAMTGKERLQRLRLIHSGGDTLTPRDVELYKRSFPPTCILLNNLGCTEVSSFSHYLIDHTTEIGTEGVPVGRPVEGAEVLLLDDAGADVPEGAVGEIAVKSRYLAVGYWRDAARTERAFRSVPGEKGVRIYHTGDLGRRLPNGNLLHVGRKDFQVQIRGFRVEAGEIERMLLRSEAIGACAVVGVKDPLEETQLAAYLVGTPGQSVTTHQLQALLQAELPSYMVPTVYVWLDALPLTANGKLDRRALPAPEWKAVERNHAFVAPRTPVERALAEIWTEVVGIPRIGAYDQFLDAGGNSLRAMQVLARVRATFGIDLPVSAAFESPVLSELALQIERALDKRCDSEHLEPISPVGPGPTPLSYAQQRMWFFNQLEPENPLYHLAVGGPGVSAKPRAGRWIGQLDVRALERSLEEIVRRHDVLRAVYPMTDEGVVQKVMPASGFRLRLEDLTSLSAAQREAQARAFAVAEACRAFDLRREPPLRAVLLRLSAEDHVLLLVVHHIAFDRWSRWILLEELFTLYTAFSAGYPSRLPPLPVQFQDYAAWQRTRVNGDRVRQGLAHWRDRLRDAPAVLALPTDRPRRAQQTYRGGRWVLPLSPDVRDQLDAIARAEGATLAMALAAAFNVLLWQWSRQTDVSMGIVVAARTRPELERLIGCFANTLILRTRLSPESSFRELLRQVRDETFAAYAHEELPFEKLVEELSPERNLGYHPLFQVLFNYLDVPRVDLTFPGVRLEDFEVDLDIAHVDLSLEVERSRDGTLCCFGYSTDLFDAPTVSRLAERYRELLAAVLYNLDTRLAALPIAAASEALVTPRLLDEIEEVSEEEAERLTAEMRGRGDHCL